MKAYKKCKSAFQTWYRVACRRRNPISLFIPPRLGMRAKDILEFYVDQIEGYEHKFHLKMLHIFFK